MIILQPPVKHIEPWTKKKCNSDCTFPQSMKVIIKGTVTSTGTWRLGCHFSKAPLIHVATEINLQPSNLSQNLIF